MTELIVAVSLFVVSHVVLAGPVFRDAITARIGEGPFLVGYSIVAAALGAWAVVAYGQADAVLLWGSPDWTRPLAIIILPVAFVLVAAGITTPNVTAWSGEKAATWPDPAPGIMKVTRHPMMWGFALWAVTHLAANGDEASLVFFGSILVLALGGMVMIDAKRRRKLGEAWSRVAAVTSLVPFAAAIQGRTRMNWGEIGWWRVALGLGAYAFFLLAHRWVTGVSILAG